MKINRQEVYDKYGGRCSYCGEEIEYKAMQVDHIQPKAYRGSDEIENLNPSCRRCNNFKSSWNLEHFRRELGEQVSRGRGKSVNFRMAEKYKQIEVKESPIVFYFELKALEAIKEEK